ncbi:hypothetical protein P3T73_14570 [Kiritimatiellota bacterium B12222]|nr:hypothetical protein P3T73_14570 [Kiritimatiellota bacterium B12222]
MPTLFSLIFRQKINILTLAVALMCVGSLPGRAAERIHGLDAEKVEITMESSLVDMVPQRGVAVHNFRVVNHMNKAGRWKVIFSVSEGWNNEKKIQSVREVEVDAQSAKTVSWEIPVFPNTEFGDYDRKKIEVKVSGPGSGGQQQTLLYSSPNHYSSNKRVTLVGFSPELRVNRDHWEYDEILEQLDNSASTIYISALDFAAMPSDVSGLSGLDVLVMTLEEWQALSVSQAMIRRWVAGGGQVLLISEKTVPREMIGAGRIMGMNYLSPFEFIARLQNMSTIDQTLAHEKAYDRQVWELAEAIPEISKSFGGIMLIVILMAGLLGPLNLWVSFRKKNTLQVIWTTPLLSLGLSLLVGLVIVLSDGFGGKGQRAVTVLLVPELDVEVLVQEQVSRTGVLLNDQFSLPEGTELYAVASDGDRSDRALRYRQLENGGWEGSWFENRSIQAQVLRRTRSNRSEVIFKRGAEPSVLSTVDATFTRLLIRDEKGGWWMVEDLAPGVEKALLKVNPQLAAKILDEQNPRKTLLFPGKDFQEKQGWFYADSVQPDRYIETLSSVRWQDRAVVYMGPVTMEAGL